MREDTTDYIREKVDSVYRAESRRVFATLIRLLVELLPEPEAAGLLALMLLQESRRAAVGGI